MNLTVINSNSSGNAYILESKSGEALLIECGVSFARIKKALHFNLRKVVACIVTHEHKDHCVAAAELMNAGVDVWASAGTHAAMGTDLNHRARVTFAGNTIVAGNFQIKAFDVKHDAAEPIGYLIYHPECGTVLFLTDSYYSEYYFGGLNNVIVEANYCQSILDSRVKEGESPKFLRDRVFTSHMSLATCKALLKANDLSQVNNIVLIHLSNDNSDSKRFQREVQEATGRRVHVAEPGLCIEFNKTPY